VHEESGMTSEMQIHTIARQMIEKHGFEAIAEAARNAQACESKGGGRSQRVASYRGCHEDDAGPASKLTDLARKAQ